MRISTLLVADAVRVRDGLLFVIGGGVSFVAAPSFPMNPQADLAIIVDVDPGEWPGELPINVRLEQLLDDGHSAVVAGYEGTYVGHVKEPDQAALVPVSLPLTPLEFPEPGRYAIVVSVGDLPDQRLSILARET